MLVSSNTRTAAVVVVVLVVVVVVVVVVIVVVVVVVVAVVDELEVVDAVLELVSVDDEVHKYSQESGGGHWKEAAQSKDAWKRESSMFAAWAQM